jgi:hypothetical protein
MKLNTAALDAARVVDDAVAVSVIFAPAVPATADVDSKAITEVAIAAAAVATETVVLSVPTVEFVGFVETVAISVDVAASKVPAAATLTGICTAVPTAGEAVNAVPFVYVNVTAVAAACDGATERTPRPNAATATSATRLKVVFVDMFFLSLVDPRTIRGSAWVEMSPS